MFRANNITDGYALTTSDNDKYVVYKEDTSSIQVDLSGASADMDVVAVDTKAAYNERNLGVVEPGQHEFDLPESSDWVIAITDR
jgi:hypothetical protein